MAVRFCGKYLNETGELLVSKFAPIIKVINSLIPQKSALKEGRPESWYFSPEGKDAYDSLSNTCEKTRFFLNYLCVVQQQSKSVSEARRNSDDELLYWLLYKIAFVMSSSMVESQLEFGGYPNVLDPQKNPFVYYVKNNVLPNTFSFYKAYDEVSLVLLRLLHGDKNNNDNHIITFLEENEPLTDLYKIERDIITIFYLPRLSNEKLSEVYLFVCDCMAKNNNQIPLEEEFDEED